MQLDSGASVALVMHGHSHEEGRTMRYDGTRATLRGTFGRQQSIVVIDHVDASEEEIPIRAATSGHGGGDGGIVEAFLATVVSGVPAITPAADSFESHFLAFLAEEARTSGEAVDVRARRDALGLTGISMTDHPDNGRSRRAPGDTAASEI